MKCLINGCYLIDNAHPRTVLGDLYGDETTFTFLARTTSKEGRVETDWAYPEYTALPVETKKCLIVDGLDRAFHRRGVIVISRANARLNQLAQEYL